MSDCKLTIPRGANRWVIARTDRDGATRDEVITTAGAFLGRILSNASPPGQRSPFDKLPGFDDRFIVGAARPIDIIDAEQPNSSAEAAQLARPGGELLARFTDCAVIRTVAAERPWIVIADFDWRAPSTEVPWPRRRVSDLGIPSAADNDLDWLVLSASFLGRAQNPDTTIGDELADDIGRVADAMIPAAKWAVGLSAAAAATLVGFYAVKQFSRKRSAA